jgi:hypothetical protein
MTYKECLADVLLEGVKNLRLQFESIFFSLRRLARRERISITVRSLIATGPCL